MKTELELQKEKLLLIIQIAIREDESILYTN